ncbi:hypothetical protein B0H14DRAFT_2556558 [Mycena olivaceomarginata]|nr:hypothetical protein B0H14DRAFT_2556558 [Mycena olivaceomarginata]
MPLPADTVPEAAQRALAHRDPHRSSYTPAPNPTRSGNLTDLRLESIRIGREEPDCPWIATRSSSSSASSCAPHPKPAKPSRKRRATKPSVPRAPPEFFENCPLPPGDLSVERRVLLDLCRQVHGGLELRFYQGFLEQLQVVYDAYCPGFANVYLPIVAKDSKDFAARVVAACITASATDDLASGSTLQRFMDTDPPRGRQFSVALMCTSQRNPVGRTVEEVRADPLHAWLLFIHHAPEGTQGKSYLLWDSDFQQRHNSAGLSTALGFENSWLEWMYKKYPNSRRRQIWQNLPLAGNVAGQHQCARLTVEFLASLVDGGLETRHGRQTLQSLAGFVNLTP